MTRIIALTVPRVKPTRHTPKPSRPFGEGIFPTRRERRMPYTQADRDWAAQNLNTDATDYDVEPDYDALAGEAEAQARIEAGCIF